jgi:hypothetical protein
LLFNKYILVGSRQEKGTHGKSRRSWEDNIKMDFKRIRYAGMELFDVILDKVQWWAVVMAVMKLWGP